ncbi:phosphate ABC transporter permease PstA [Ponticoccus sp. SC2-23]|uniref:phosphate ABC transporter permease PstA n=1 Tax=Alexandriicola marinus TaxID=2081710 RepID=UPI000FD8A8D6|nr:phosphate ABC transporter permease PstA [Alexandriicola marinus]MBM1218857.1 phosphate ABC transporter permease PstA [Ponticoccus sp. SC6-9]MBM1224071.1 phosphate ABC transporter permease PstA [Ponticoccus sp. SC6-15]MBM1230150.1 phosphate ABC transporter permease PstA [Ponticoccus sp. SC6-38]MBM1233037.1 phosphate ABC transporter permease PstA [Ponticoccus sp. SC6-45]MBM1237013.1 phosphate ABC transporter permease PstA [Ponticoccus sp. SC6-49]MBM1242048.1 phosphate ABC transporter permeas
MTDTTPLDAAPAGKPTKSILVEDERTRARNRAEARFRAYGIAAIAIAATFLVILLATIVVRGVPAFTQTYMTLDVTLEANALDPNGTGDRDEIAKVTTFGYQPLIGQALVSLLEEQRIETPLPPPALILMLSQSAPAVLRDAVLDDPSLIGQTVTFELLTSSRADGYFKGRVTRESLARDRNLGPPHLDILDQLAESGHVERRFNLDFITGSDASESRPESAGIGVSMIGSFFMMLVVLFLSLPIGVAASIYLEEFAPQNRFTDFIEVNISNLAAVPSIVFGILGLAIFIQVMHLPQSAPLVGGLVLTLMTLPTIIISTRASLKSVPPSIREAALGVGASKMQTVFHHVLPLAMPGILTGTIIGLAQALGETAPLLLIGMVGFIASNYPAGVAEGFLDPNSAMPAQIYEWAKRADPAYYERAWGGIIVLLVFLMSMNLLAILLRRRFERRW